METEQLRIPNTERLGPIPDSNVILSCKLSNYYYSQKSEIFFLSYFILLTTNQGYSFLTRSKFLLFYILDFHSLFPQNP